MRQMFRTPAVRTALGRRCVGTLSTSSFPPSRPVLLRAFGRQHSSDLLNYHKSFLHISRIRQNLTGSAPGSGIHTRKMLIVQAIMRLFDVHSRRFETILQPKNPSLAYFRSDSTSPDLGEEPEPCDMKNSPANFEFVSACPQELCDAILKDFIVIDDFLSEADERSLLEEAESQIARVRYENEENWDNAIIGYRETERKNWNSENKKILKRVREVSFPPGVSQLVNVHILDLAKSGYIKPHVDSVRFCGDTVAGLSLLSNSVMRLVHETEKDPVIDVLLKRRSLYIMRGIARYNYTHEILKESQSVFKREVIERDRRISLIFRNEPSDDDE